MTSGLFYVGFEGNQVSVQSNNRDILLKAKVVFGSLVEETETNVIGAVSIQESAGGFSLRENQETRDLECPLNDVVYALKVSAINMLMDVRADLLWVHAGAVTRQAGAVLFPGSYGRGKSTLATSLCARGWQYLSDDLAPIDLVAERVYPFPQAPRLREHQGKELPRESLNELTKNEVLLDPGVIGKRSAKIRALIFPEFSLNGATELVVYSKSMAVLGLIQNAVNFNVHNSETVTRLCGLVEKLPTYSLPFSDAKKACDLIDDILKAD